MDGKVIVASACLALFIAASVAVGRDAKQDFERTTFIRGCLTNFGTPVEVLGGGYACLDEGGVQYEVSVEGEDR